MMNLHFENWTAPIWLEQIEQNGLMHGGSIVKVFGNETDPRHTCGKPDLTVVEVDDSEFMDESYSYTDRGTYNGEALEADLAALQLQTSGVKIVRALFRFAEQYPFRQVAMAAKKPDGSWLIDHPFGNIDGLKIAAMSPRRTYGIHLDIFHPDSLHVLRSVVDFDDERKVMKPNEAMRWRMQNH